MIQRMAPITAPKRSKDPLLDVRSVYERLAKRPENKGKSQDELARMAAARVVRRMIRRRLGIADLKDLPPKQLEKLKKLGLVGGAKPKTGTIVQHKITRGPRKGQTVRVRFKAGGGWSEVKSKTVNLSDSGDEAIDLASTTVLDDPQAAEARRLALSWDGGDPDDTEDDLDGGDDANVREALSLLAALEPEGDPQHELRDLLGDAAPQDLSDDEARALLRHLPGAAIDLTAIGAVIDAPRDGSPWLDLSASSDDEDREAARRSAAAWARMNGSPGEIARWEAEGYVEPERNTPEAIAARERWPE